MAKFTTPDINDDTAQPKMAMDQIQSANTPIVTPVVSPSVVMANPDVAMAQQTAQVQAQASVGLAQAAIDDKVVDEQIKKEEEHWVRAYWRPAMGWLYMVICAFDFVLFPLLAMFLPVIDKGFGLNIAYTPWQSLTLSNGGLMHLAFGAILGVSAWTRGQEKLAKV